MTTEDERRRVVLEVLEIVRPEVKSEVNAVAETLTAHIESGQDFRDEMIRDIAVLKAMIERVPAETNGSVAKSWRNNPVVIAVIANTALLVAILVFVLVFFGRASLDQIPGV